VIIDSHTHIVESDAKREMEQNPRISADTLVKWMDRTGIDRAVTFTEKGLYSYDEKENDNIASATKKHPDRLIGFACVNPRYGDEAAEELERAIVELGLNGLKLHPWFQLFSCTEKIVEPVFDKVVKLKIPVLIHTGYDIFSGPLDVSDLADRYTEVPIIMGHSGCCGLWFDGIKAAKRSDNLYLEMSGNLSVAIEKMVSEVGAEKVLFGSDTPWVDPALEILKIKTLRICSRDKELILGENLRKLLVKWGI